MADTIYYRFVMKRDTAANFTSKNTLLLNGEYGFETDTKKKKVGDGVTFWNALPYDTSAGTLTTTAPIHGGGSMGSDLTLTIDEATRSAPGVMSPADKVTLDATHGDGTTTQVGATLMQTGSATALMPSSSSSVSKSITFDIPYDTVKGVFIEPSVGSVSSSGDTPAHYVTKTNTGFTVNFKAAANITKDIPFDWMAFGIVSGSGIAALSGAFKRIRIGVAYSSDLTASGGNGVYSLYGGTGLVSGTLPAGLSLSVVSTNLLRLSGTCTEAAPTTLSGVVGVATGDGQVATSSQTFTVANAFSPSELFSLSENGAWYDPSDLTSMFQDSAGTTPVTAVGQSVGRINDKSGNGNHAVQPTSGSQPTLQADGSGNKYLSFSGSQFLYVANPNSLAPGTNSLVAVTGAMFNTSSGNQCPWCRSIAASGDARIALLRDSIFATLYAYNGSTGVVEAGGSDTSTSIRVSTSIVNRPIGLATTRNNGTTFGSTLSFTHNETVNQTAAYRFLIGCYNNASDTGQSLFLTGRIYGIVLRYTSTVDATSMNDTEQWMADQCGLTFTST